MSQHSTLAAGIDVAKKTLELAVHGQTLRLTVANDAAGWQRLTTTLQEVRVSCVGLEATGGYERGIAAHLRRNGLEVRLLQPVQIKAFARLHLRRAKSDPLDAALIAACTAALEVPVGAHDARLEACADLLTFIEQIEEDLARCQTRLEHTMAPWLRHLIESDLARLRARLQAELHRLAAALRQFDDLAARLALVLSIPGIGERTAFAIVVRLPEPRPGLARTGGGAGRARSVRR